MTAGNAASASMKWYARGKPPYDTMEVARRSTQTTVSFLASFGARNRHIRFARLE